MSDHERAARCPDRRASPVCGWRGLPALVSIWYISRVLPGWEGSVARACGWQFACALSVRADGGWFERGAAAFGVSFFTGVFVGAAGKRGRRPQWIDPGGSGLSGVVRRLRRFWSVSVLRLAKEVQNLVLKEEPWSDRLGAWGF